MELNESDEIDGFIGLPLPNKLMTKCLCVILSKMSMVPGGTLKIGSMPAIQPGFGIHLVEAKGKHTMDIGRNHCGS
jgi:hypothetical protein